MLKLVGYRPMRPYRRVWRERRREVGDCEGCRWDGACVQELGEACCYRCVVVLGKGGCFFWWQHAKVVVAARTRTEEEEQPRCLQVIEGWDGSEELCVLSECALKVLALVF